MTNPPNALNLGNSAEARMLRLYDSLRLGSPVEEPDRSWLIAAVRQYAFVDQSSANFVTNLGI